MTIEQVLSIKRLLEGNFLKVKEQEDAVYIGMLSEYKYEIMLEAVKNFIKTSKFAPTIANLIEEFEKASNFNKTEIVRQMYLAGKFFDPTEYEKAIKWVTSGIIPEWFEKQIKVFANNYLTTNSKQRNLLNFGGTSIDYIHN